MERFMCFASFEDEVGELERASLHKGGVEGRTHQSRSNDEKHGVHVGQRSKTSIEVHASRSSTRKLNTHGNPIRRPGFSLS